MALEFKNYDQRHYPEVGVKEGYSAWSKNYEQGFDHALDMTLLNRIHSIPWNKVDTAADLACGTGRTGQWLKSKGIPFVDGVDLTEAMMMQADGRNIYRKLVLEDFRQTSLSAGIYNLVVNSLAAEHIPDLLPLYKEARRLLRHDGHFILLGFHPHFQLRGISTHYDDSETGKSVAIANHIHLLSDYVKAGAAVGMSLIELDEYVVDETWVARAPNMQKHLGHPISFVGVWKVESPLPQWK